MYNPERCCEKFGPGKEFNESHLVHCDENVDSKTSEFAETIRESRFKRRALSMRVLNFRKNSGRVSPSSNAQPVRFGVGSAKSLRLLC